MTFSNTEPNHNALQRFELRFYSHFFSGKGISIKKVLSDLKNVLDFLWCLSYELFTQHSFRVVACLLALVTVYTES